MWRPRDRERYIGSYDPEHEMPDPDRNAGDRWQSDAYRHGARDGRIPYRMSPNRFEHRFEGRRDVAHEADIRWNRDARDLDRANYGRGDDYGRGSYGGGRYGSSYGGSGFGGGYRDTGRGYGYGSGPGPSYGAGRGGYDRDLDRSFDRGRSYDRDLDDGRYDDRDRPFRDRFYGADRGSYGVSYERDEYDRDREDRFFDDRGGWDRDRGRWGR